MKRRWVLVLGAIALAAALLVGAQLLSARRTTAAPTVPAAPSSSQTATGTAQRQRAPQRLEPIPATAAAANGAPLHPLSSSPPSIISGFALGRVPAGASYTITLQPWGYGPGGRHGLDVAAKILSAAPLGEAPGVGTLKGAMLLLVMDDRTGGVVYTGGTSQGVVTFIQDGSVLFPKLTDVKTQTP